MAASARAARSPEVPTDGWEIDVGAGRAFRDAIDDMTAWFHKLIRGIDTEDVKGPYVAIGYFGSTSVDLFFLTESMFRCDRRLLGKNCVI